MGFRGSRVERRPPRGLRSARPAAAGRRPFGPDASNPAVPTRVSSFHPPLVIVAGNSSAAAPSVKTGGDLVGMDPNHAYRPGDLPRLWEERAALLHQYGDPNSARLWQLAAVELEQALKALGDETLTLTEAAAACGYSAAHLGRAIPRWGTLSADSEGVVRVHERRPARDQLRSPPAPSCGPFECPRYRPHCVFPRGDAALPQHQHAPALAVQGSPYAAVARSVACELSRPVRPVRYRRLRPAAMRVPKAALHE